MNSDYVLVSRWRLPVSRDALWDELERLLATSDPMAWWPSVRVVAYADGVMRMRASSGLGYAVTFELSNLETTRPDRLSFVAHGDLRGRGEVTFADGADDTCAMDIDWRVATDRAWMRRTAWVLRPVFVAGHHLVMRRGERHLNAWMCAQGR